MSALSSPKDSYQIKLLIGEDREGIFPFIAQQRVKVFREYPYLYDSTWEEDLPYLSIFAKSSHTAIAVAYLDGKPVGFLAGTCFLSYASHYKGAIELFTNAGKDPNEYYYFTDVIVLPEHRDEFLATRFFEKLEHFARERGFAFACLVTESHQHHPLKPAHYKDTTLWTRLGYEKTDLSIFVPWNTIQLHGPSKEQMHELYYWIKKLR